MTRCATLLLSGIFWVSPIQAQDLMRLGDLISVAERNNLSFVEGRLSRERAEASVTAARSEFLPKLLLESSLLFSNDADQHSSSAALVLRQNFYDGGKSWTTFQRSRLSRSQSEISEQRALEIMSHEVLKAFVACSRLERNRSTAKRKLEVLEIQFDSARRQFRQGRKTQRDYQLLEAEVERNRLQLASLEDSVYAAYRDLEKVVGSDENSLNVKNVELLSVDRVVALKSWLESEASFTPETESFELRALKLAVEDEDLALSQAKREYWPMLGAYASASYGSTSSLSPYTLGLGLQLTWTLWDFGGTPARVSQARVNQVLASKQYDQKKLDLVNDYKVLTRSLERRARTLDVQKRIRDLERSSFTDIERSYREGLSSYLELISALDRDVDAEQNFEDEVFNYFVSLSDLLRLKGKLYEKAKTL